MLKCLIWVAATGRHYVDIEVIKVGARSHLYNVLFFSNIEPCKIRPGIYTRGRGKTWSRRRGWLCLCGRVCIQLFFGKPSPKCSSSSSSLRCRDQTCQPNDDDDDDDIGLESCQWKVLMSKSLPKLRKYHVGVRMYAPSVGIGTGIRKLTVLVPQNSATTNMF